MATSPNVPVRYGWGAHISEKISGINVSVYVSGRQIDGSQHVGMSEDVKERLKEHNYGGVTSTKQKRPWYLLFEEHCAKQPEARKREKYLKTAAGRRFRKEIMGD